MLPETNYDRPTDAENGEGLDSSEFTALRSRTKFHWARSLSLVAWYDRETPIWWLFLRPFTLLRYPAIVWVAITHGVVLGWVVLQQTANSFYFPDGYHFSARGVGNINVANVVGGSVGCLVGGWGSDWAAVYISKRSNGCFKPEFRLWCMLPSVVFGPIGLMMWGAGLGDHLRPMVAIAGTSITYGVLCAAAATTMTYVIDCYRPIAGEVVMILVAFRNTFAFGFSFAVVPWIERCGYKRLGGYMTLIEGVIFLIATPMYVYGPQFRQWTTKFPI